MFLIRLILNYNFILFFRNTFSLWLVPKWKASFSLTIVICIISKEWSLKEINYTIQQMIRNTNEKNHWNLYTE